MKVVYALFLLLIFLPGCYEKGDSATAGTHSVKADTAEAGTPETSAEEQKSVKATAGLRVRSSPGTDSGTTGVLDFLATVTITKENDAVVNIDGLEGKWVYITSPLEGWVFDGYLDSSFEDALMQAVPSGLAGIDEARLYVKDSENNKFIGYIDPNSINYEYKIGDICIYNKYIYLNEFQQHDGRWYVDGLSIYEYDEGMKFSEYKTLGKKVYTVADEPFWFEGIYDDMLFMDIGTSPGIRGIEIVDLLNNEVIFSGYYYDRFAFENDTVTGLVITKRDIEEGTYDDGIVRMFNQYSEELEERRSLSTRFILHYNYNIRTEEIEVLSGEYIYEQ